MQITVRVTGLAEAERKLGPQVLARPVRNWFERSTIAIQNEARERAPVDTGRLRNNIMRQIDSSLVPRWGLVGTDVHYSVYVHQGTRPHWPPIAPIRAWARRHRVNPYAVQRAIARRGTRARPFLRDGMNAALPAVQRYLTVLAAEIEQEAER